VYVGDMTDQKKMQKKNPSKTASMVETIYGCKWSLTVYTLIKNGILRPGEMVKSVDGLTTKVLNQCLKKNLKFGILEKDVFQELPPRVQYRVSKFGVKFIGVLDQIEDLNKELKK
jgi:DNA-binding HxlR family transcriptional regulator